MSELDKKFEEAFHIASTTKVKCPPDIMLQFYAYYKLATEQYLYNNNADSNEDTLINAFKMNALMQLNNITKEEAKQAYIDLVKKYLKT